MIEGDSLESGIISGITVYVIRFKTGDCQSPAMRRGLKREGGGKESPVNFWGPGGGPGGGRIEVRRSLL